MKQSTYESLPNREASTSPTLSDLLMQRSELEQAMDLAYEGLDAATAQLTPEIYTALEQLLDEHAVLDSNDEIDVMLQHGKDLLSTEYCDALRDSSELGQQLSELDDRMDQLAGDSLCQYVEGEAQLLRQQIRPDADEVMASTAEEYLGTFETAESRLRHLSKIRPRMYRMGEQAFDELEKHRVFLNDTGLLTNYRDVLTDGSSSAGPGIEFDEIEHALELNNRYRVYHNELSVSEAQGRPILPMHDFKISIDQEQREALRCHLQSLDIKKEVDRIAVQGLELLPFEFSDEQLRQVLYTIPAIAFEGVRSLTFKYDDEEKDDSVAEALGGEWETSAQYTHSTDENQSRVVIWVDPVKARYEQTKESFMLGADGQLMEAESLTEARLYGIEALKGHIVHEFGHAFHATLPVSLLNDWDKVVRSHSSDRTVTSYVDRMQEIEHDNYEMEDFADSFKLTLLDPYGMNMTAPARFWAMRDLIMTCRPQL